MTDTPKTGLPTWLMWTLGIIFLPIGIVWGLVVMWRRGSFNVGVRIALTLLAPVALFVLAAVGVGMVQGIAAIGTTPAATAPAAEAKKPEPVKEVAPKPAKEPSFADGEVTQATVKTVEPSLNGGATVAVEVQDNLGTDAPSDKIVHVKYEPDGGAGLAPRPLLMDLAKTSSGMFRALFANPNVSAADVTAVVVMVGTDGAETKTAGARINWDRAKADSINWADYESNVAGGYYWDAFNGATDYYLHPGVIAGLKDEDRAKLQR